MNKKMIEDLMKQIMNSNEMNPEQQQLNKLDPWMYSSTDFTFENDEAMNRVISNLRETFPLFIN